jgi:putative ABC transport system ATP-binding protein
MRAVHGSTLLLITHDTELAGRCDRCIHMSDGRVAEAQPAAASHIA